MIPSRAAVLQARQRRERIREMGGFVPLEETSYTKELDSDELDSRLVRDEEEDAEPGTASFSPLIFSDFTFFLKKMNNYLNTVQSFLMTRRAGGSHSGIRASKKGGRRRAFSNRSRRPKRRTAKTKSFAAGNSNRSKRFASP